jgi:hypothetical protein
LVYRLWYLFGAIYVAAFLGMGTIYLLARPRFAHTILVILVALSLASVVRIFTVHLDLSQITTLTGTAMPDDIRLLAPFFNVFGTVALIGGAIYSAWIFWRRRILAHRVVANILIAVGALLPAIGGSWLRFGAPRVPYYSLELAGIVIIFVGFLRTREVFGFFRFPLIHGFHPVPVTPQELKAKENKQKLE